MTKKLYEKYRDIIIKGIISVFIGIIVGVIDTCFGKMLILITEFRDNNSLRLIPFLSVAGAAIIYTYNKIGNNSIKGMTLIFEAASGEVEKIHKRLIPLTIISTWITHLFGGSAGREGVAVQIGATVSHTIGRKINIKNSRRIFLVTGMAAGFAGLFQTPIAAVFFALEVLIAGSLEYSALFTALIAAFSASTTSHILGLEKFTFALSTEISIDFYFIIKLAVLGVVFGVVGGLFAHLLANTKKVLANIINDPILKIFLTGIVLSIFLIILHKGRYSGLGTNLIANSFNSNEVYNYDWILKFIFTIITLSVGFQGGEVTPLFSIGASLGVFLGTVLGVPIELAAALGYAAVFGGATNTFLAPIFIGAEVFGFEYVPLFFVTCCLAYVFNGSKSIYSAQKIIENA
ncbi:chloride channel protein [uncultured Clostridium sp.]|uniref:chloride channel protein n=1 Tax=uncultured Clostridium sp. TaxID=59620 RepID=UPI0025CF4E7A|nr:chloride channel protein [uncultured Clostridium sp.]